MYSPKPLFASSQVEKLVNSPKPLFSAEEVKPKALIHCPYLPEVKSSSPKAMFTDSKIRKRLDIALPDLDLYQGNKEEKSKALQQILSTNVDDLSVEYVLNWGSREQLKHKEVLHTILNSALDEETTSIKSTIYELIEHLNTINFVDLNKSSIFSSAESKIGKAKVALKDISKICDKLSSEVPSLKAAYSKYKGLNEKLIDLESQFTPWIISCDFFSKYKKDNFPNELFISRLTSLLSSKTTILSNKQTISFLQSSSINLIDSIESIIQTEVTLWMNSFISSLTQKSCTSNIDLQRDTIINKLKSKIS